MAKKEVTVYSTPFCPYCTTLKQFLNKNEVEFENIDVSKDKKAARKMMEKTGQSGVPVTEIDGETVVGFDREEIVRLLEL